MSRTVEALLRDAGERLRAAGVPSPRADARLLLRAVLDRSAEASIRDPDGPVPIASADRFLTLVERRAGRKPVSRILGEREFWSLGFSLVPDTLDPRPDSEAVVDAALAWCGNRSEPLRVLDLGTGTGCLLLSVLSELPRATGVGTDIAEAAVAAAAQNAARHGLSRRASFRRTDWDADIEGQFELILSNPPYIPSSEIGGLEPEVSLWEPRAALDGGADGLDAYRRLAPAIAGRLAPGGAAFLEIGSGQERPVETIMAAEGLARFARKADLSGIVRCLGFIRRG
ncbi:MAG: peptide chain release factor N(5)-glutamine methyltransferase [Defluviicoccus sp.]|nr:peptide chain release factor N(5)-glutamine methyltransferase [Defluviicoccus sp.]MDE0278888.1 peptide chain release factor N(5)-glutamine methyltransferase [Defluviicoccus sp.]